MLIAQLTDCHIKPGGRPAYTRVDTVAHLAAAVAHVNAFRPAIDRVVVSGDLVDFGTAAEYAVLRPLLDRLAPPYHVIPGNHDGREAMRATFADHAYLADPEWLHWVVDTPPIRLVGLDSLVAGAPHGELCPARLAWLDAALGASAKPALVFVHHPPFETGIRHMDVQGLRDADAFLAVLARHKGVRHVACGHVHRAIETMRHGIPLSIAPNAAHAVTLDLDPEGSLSFTMEPPAIRLFRVGDDGTVTAHLSYLGPLDGPHPFFHPDGRLID